MSTASADTALVEKLKVRGFEHLTELERERLFELYAASKVQSDVVVGAMAETTGAARAGLRTLESLHDRYAAASTTNHAGFIDVSKAVVDALRSVVNSPDLSPEHRLDAARQIAGALDRIARVEENKAAHAASTAKTYARVAGAMALGAMAAVVAVVSAVSGEDDDA